MILTSNTFGKWSPKDPLDFINPATVQFGLVVPSGAQLTGTPAVSASPSGAPGDLAIGNVSISGTDLLVQLAAGVAGVTYQVSCLVQDTAGNTWHRTVPLLVRAL